MDTSQILKKKPSETSRGLYLRNNRYDNGTSFPDSDTYGNISPVDGCSIRSKPSSLHLNTIDPSRSTSKHQDAPSRVFSWPAKMTLPTKSVTHDHKRSKSFHKLEAQMTKPIPSPTINNNTVSPTLKNSS